MKKSIKFNPFLVYSEKLKAQFQAAKASDNPALFVYKNGGRNIIFMLEGLARIHKNAFDLPKMDKWFDRFKQLEDLLGQIDYLDAFKTQFETDKVIDAKGVSALNTKIDALILTLNDVLIAENWLDNILFKFDAFIDKTAFKYNVKYTEKIVKTYKKDIKKITSFATDLNFEIHEVETELHELRRKLRWLSIYSLAFNGLVQLKKPTENPAWSAPYMTEKIVNSPFNKMPQAIDNLPVIYLNYPNFIALSFIIQEFGHLKDKGLANELLATEFKKSEAAIKKLLGDKYLDKPTILKHGSQLLKTFFEDNVLANLIVTY